jgi:hypothetical protein
MRGQMALRIFTQQKPGLWDWDPLVENYLMELGRRCHPFSLFSTGSGVRIFLGFFACVIAFVSITKGDL